MEEIYKRNPSSLIDSQLLAVKLGNLKEEYMNTELEQVALEVKLLKLKNRCIDAGLEQFVLDTIWDSRPIGRSHYRHIGTQTDEASTPSSNLAQELYSRHPSIFEVRKNTIDANLLGDWSGKRDRINRWLLHSLRWDDSLAHLHRSMLVDRNIDEASWARMVLQYWFLDEAATGLELPTSLSVEAIDGRTGFSLESFGFRTCPEVHSANSSLSAES